MFNAMSLLLLAFMVEHIGIAAATAGLLILVSKIYDAVTDPLMGVLTDRTKSRWGRRRPYLLLGGFLAGGSFIMVFTVPAFDSQAALLIYVVVALLLNATAYTVFNVPYFAMPAEMTESYHERTRLMSCRVGAVAGGQVLSSVLGPVIIAYFGGGLFGHSVMSIVVGVAIIAVCTVCFWSTQTAAFTTQVTETPHTLSDQLRLAVENKPFFILLMVKFRELYRIVPMANCLNAIKWTLFCCQIPYVGPSYALAEGDAMTSNAKSVNDPAAHQPTKAELEEDVCIDATPEALAWAVTRGGADRRPLTRQAPEKD